VLTSRPGRSLPSTFTDVFPPLAAAVLTDAEPVADAVPLPLLLLSEQAISSMLQPSTPTPTARTRFTRYPLRLCASPCGAVTEQVQVALSATDPNNASAASLESASACPEHS